MKKPSSGVDSIIINFNLVNCIAAIARMVFQEVYIAPAIRNIPMMDVREKLFDKRQYVLVLVLNTVSWFQENIMKRQS